VADVLRTRRAATERGLVKTKDSGMRLRQVVLLCVVVAIAIGVSGLAYALSGLVAFFFVMLLL